MCPGCCAHSSQQNPSAHAPPQQPRDMAPGWQSGALPSLSCLTLHPAHTKAPPGWPPSPSHAQPLRCGGGGTAFSRPHAIRARKSADLFEKHHLRPLPGLCLSGPALGQEEGTCSHPGPRLGREGPGTSCKYSPVRPLSSFPHPSHRYRATPVARQGSRNLGPA